MQPQSTSCPRCVSSEEESSDSESESETNESETNESESETNESESETNESESRELENDDADSDLANKTRTITFLDQDEVPRSFI